MTAYKVTGENAPSNLKGRFFCPFQSHVILLADYTRPQSFYDTWVFSRLKEKGELQEVDLLDEKWIHPHLYKPIQEEVKRNIA